MKALKKIPDFKNETEEREFWQTHDSTQYVDYSRVEKWSFPNLKLSSRPITIRLPETLINRLKIKGHKMDIPYQTLIKQVLWRDSLRWEKLFVQNS